MTCNRLLLSAIFISVGLVLSHGVSGAATAPRPPERKPPRVRPTPPPKPVFVVKPGVVKRGASASAKTSKPGSKSQRNAGEKSDSTSNTAPAKPQATDSSGGTSGTPAGTAQRP